MQTHPHHLRPGGIYYSLCTDEVFSSNDFTVYVYLGPSGPDDETLLFYHEPAYAFAILFQFDEPMTDIYQPDRVELYHFCLIDRYSEEEIQNIISVTKSGHIHLNKEDDFCSRIFNMPVSRPSPTIPLLNPAEAFDTMYNHARIHHADELNKPYLYFPKSLRRNFFIEALSPYVQRPFITPSPSFFI